MKTLDEVIDALEICSQMDAECDKCPYKATAKGWCEEKDRDALRYLKEYQWQMTNPDGDHLQLEKCRALLSDFYQNEPLSWEELKQMEGKPVWVIWLESGFREWVLAHAIIDDQIWFTDCDGGIREEFKDMMGTDWQAYRKERE